MGAGARIAREGQRAQTVPGGIHKMEMIQHPQGIQTLHGRLLALLPVQPPEVHALLLHGMQHILKVVVHEFRRSRIKGHRLLGGRIHAHMLRQRGIRLFIGADTVCGMQIQRRLHAAIMQIFQEGHVIREKLGIPRIARPAAAVFRIDLRQVPVHVNDRHAHRHILLVEAIHQGEVLRLCIGIVAAPPVAHGEARQHGHLTRKAEEIPQSG